MVLSLFIGAAIDYYNGEQEGRAARRGVRAGNQKIRLNNLSVYRETAQEISGLLAGQSILRRQSSDAWHNADRAALLGLSSADTLAGAAGLQGASIDAIAMDIERELSNAQADIAQSVELEQFNMSQQLRSLVSARRSQLGQEQRVPSTSEIRNAAITSAAMSTINQYANAYFEFGAPAKSKNTADVGASRSGYTGAAYQSWLRG